MLMSESGNPCPTLGQLLASRIVYRALGKRKTAQNRQGKILYTELLKSRATLGQPPCQLPTPWEVARVFLAIVVLWQHPSG